MIATPATVRSHAYFQAIKEENPAIEVYEHATPALVPLVEAGDSRARGGSGRRPRRSRRCSASATRTASSSFRCRRPARIDTLLLGCTHYPLLRPLIQAAAGERVAIVDSASATASALAELLSVNGLEAPGTSRGTAADAGGDGHERRPRVRRPARATSSTRAATSPLPGLAARLFGSEFPDVQSVALRAAVS